MVNLTLKSKPNSYVGLLGVDQSVLLLKSGNDIDENLVNSELTGYSYPNEYNFEWEDNIVYHAYTDFIMSAAIILTNAKEEYRRPIEIVPGAPSASFSGAGNKG